MKIIPIASGSSGNCFFLELGGRKILIDLGVTAKMMTAALTGNGYSLSEVEAVLLTHSHNDHVRGLDVCMKKLSAPLFTSSATKETLCLPDARVLPYGKRTEILPELFVTAFRTPHDAIGSVGFIIETGGEKLGYATDVGHVTDEMRQLLRGSDLIVLEANHDVDMLRQGRYPVFLKRRILSDNGHLSNDDCGEAVEYFESCGTKNFLLAHLSRENNTPRMALECVRKCVPYDDVHVDVLPPEGDCLLVYDKPESEENET